MQKIFYKNSFLLASGRLMIKIEGSGFASRSESGSGCIRQRHGSADPDPDPHQNTWIRNIAGGTGISSYLGSGLWYFTR
jgi:hypothetical protein